MRGSKVLKTFAVSSLLVGAALAGPNPSTTVSTQPNPVIKGNTSRAGEREIHMHNMIYDPYYYSRPWGYTRRAGYHPYIIHDANIGCYRGRRYLCLRNPRFKITEGNLGDLFVSYTSGISRIAISYCTDYFYNTYCEKYYIRGQICVKGVLIHDGGSRSGKLCVGEYHNYIPWIYNRSAVHAGPYVFIPDP